MATPTADPDIEVIAGSPRQADGYVKYRRRSNGAEWEVRGVCDRRGDCLIGAVVENEHGEPEQVRDHAHIAELQARLGRARIDSELDVPVTPGFEGCCPLQVTVTKGNPVVGE